MSFHTACQSAFTSVGSMLPTAPSLDVAQSFLDFLALIIQRHNVLNEVSDAVASPAKSAAPSLDTQLSKLAGDVLMKDWAAGAWQLASVRAWSVTGDHSIWCVDTANPKLKYTKQNLGKLLDMHLSLAGNQQELLERLTKSVPSCT
jgi:hypothetical protein